MWIAEYLPYREEYRLYDESCPIHTIAYFGGNDDLSQAKEEAAARGVQLKIEDKHEAIKAWNGWRV